MNNTAYRGKLRGSGALVSMPRHVTPSELGGRFFENLVTKKQLAEHLAVSEGFINKLMTEEGLPHFKLGRAVRYRVKEVASWLQQRRKP